MRYVFMNKNTPLLECEIDPSSGSILKIYDLLYKGHLPVAMVNQASTKDKLTRELARWWSRRGIPASRENLTWALQRIGIFGSFSTKELLIKSLGLNLSDQYWMNPEGRLNWSDVNFFENPFSDDIGNMLFLEPINKDQIDHMSPDSGSDGVLKKRWKIINDKRILIKAGSGPFHQEPINEVIASDMMKNMRIHHVSYTHEYYEDLPYSLCETFIDTNTELVHASQIMDSMDYEYGISKLQHFKEACDRLGVSDIDKELGQMFALDFIIDNSDRHFNNFGLIRNVETLEWQGFAPIYDSGTAMWNKQLVPGQAEHHAATFAPSNKEQLDLIPDFPNIELDGLMQSNTKSYYNILKVSPYITKERASQIIGGINNNIKVLNGIIRQKQRSISMANLTNELLKD